MKNRDKGFTLIESAIVIMVLSFVLIPLFQFMTEQEEQKQRYQSDRKNERIVAAINEYYKVNREYPCPANLATPITNANFGQATACGAGTVSSGGLPVYDLGLPWEYAVNRYGWKYTYHVTRAMTDGPRDTGIIRIDDGNSVFAQNIHFIVVDPGKDGKGSRTINGVVSPVVCNTAKDSENCAGAADLFTEAEISDNENVLDPEYYDDKLLYSLGSPNDSLWLVKNTGSMDNNDLDIINRNDGRIGIGFADTEGFISASRPEQKLHVKGGRGGAIGAMINGGVNVDDWIRANNNIRAGNNVVIGNDTVAPSFCYGTEGTC